MDDTDPEAPLMSVKDATITFVKSLVGVGILSVPYAFKCSGVLVGILGLFILWMLFVHTHTLLVDCRDKLLDGSKPELSENSLDISRVVLEAGGQVHADLTGLMVFALQFGVVAAYQIFISVNLNDVFGWNQKLIVLACCAPFYFLSMVRIKSIQWTMLIGLVSLCLGYAVVYVHDIGHLKPVAKINWLKVADFPTYFGIVLFDMVSTTCVLPIVQDMEDKTAFRWVLQVSFAIAFFIFASFGLLGYWCFGDTVKPMIVRSLPPSVFLSAVKVFMCVGLFCTFPLQLYPAVEIATQWKLCGGNGTGTLGTENDSEESEKAPLKGAEEGSVDAGATGSAKGPNCYFYVIRCLVIGLSACVAIFIPDFGFVLAITGALCASLLGITYPCFAYVRLQPDGELPTWKVFGYYLLSFVGFAGGIYCSIQIIIGKAKH